MASPGAGDSAGDAVGLLRRVDVAALDGRRRIHVAVWAESATPRCQARRDSFPLGSPGSDPTHYVSAVRGRCRHRRRARQYALTVPFMELFFRLAHPSGQERPAGWVGQITSNSFMKREFGSKLIEEFLPTVDLRTILDTSGAYIPGHGTPTVINIGRNQVSATGSVHAVLGIRGEPSRPANAAKGLVWASITEHIGDSCAAWRQRS